MSMPTLQSSHDWLIHILDTIDEGIHAVDADGVTIVYNAAAARMDGLSGQEVVGQHILSAFPSLGQETSTLLQVLENGHAIYNRPQTYNNYLGTKVHTVNTTLPIVAAGHVVGALEIAKDLTQVRHLADQVMELQAQAVGVGSGRRKKTGDTPLLANYQMADILTQDESMLKLKGRAQQAARTTSPILVYGETGTGKELLVQAIHNASPRQLNPFLAMNCAALPASLLEGILFGTVRGSFTGAEERPGLFELADGGTLFLDEIQSMPLDLQPKLLRVLQEGELMRVGDTRLRRINVRVVAAMNQQPEAALKAGLLRADLYYRINVVRLDVPALRNRTRDIPHLTEHFIAKYNRQFDVTVEGLDEDASRLFLDYPWPGNVRELGNALESAMNLRTEGEICSEELPYALREWGTRTVEAGEVGRVQVTTSKPDDWVDVVAKSGWPVFWDALKGDGQTADWEQHAPSWKSVQLAMEGFVLARALTTCHGNVKRAAKRLGMPRQTLQYRLQQMQQGNQNT